MGQRIIEVIVLQRQAVRLSRIKYVCFAFACLLIGAGCSHSSVSKAACSFEYSVSVKDKIILPVLKNEVPDLYPYFNIENPTITKSKRNVKVILSPLNKVNGKTVFYENSYVFIIDSCSRELIEFYEVVRN